MMAKTRGEGERKKECSYDDYLFYISLSIAQKTGMEN
jgi:hypothetical protein